MSAWSHLIFYTILHPAVVGEVTNPCITTTHLSYSFLSLKLPPPPCSALFVTRLYIYYIHLDAMWEMISSCCYTGAMPCNAQLLLEHTGATTCVEALGQKLHRAPSLFALVLGLFLGFGFCRMTCCWRSLAA